MTMTHEITFTWYGQRITKPIIRQLDNGCTIEDECSGNGIARIIMNGNRVEKLIDTCPETGRIRSTTNK